MEIPSSQSYFQAIRSSEISGFRARKRKCSGDSALDFSEVGAMGLEHNGYDTPALALSFCKSSKNSHILAVSDEDGYVSLFDTHQRFSPSSSHDENADKARVCEWLAHNNAVFDISWIKEDTQILTASGDQTMKVWDIQGKKCIAVLEGHTGSVKSVSPHPTNPDVIVSCSRDGSFALWDMRCNFSSRSEGVRICSTAVVKQAHYSRQAKRMVRWKAASTSVTSILYLKDGVSIATAGAVDSIVKFWDSRNTKTAFIQTHPHTESNEKEKRLHGISSLSQDLNGVLLSASCMDNRIYMYNVLQPEKGPIKSFSGCQIKSFYVKSSISPDAAHILSGSSDGNAYIWQVNKPQDPVVLKNHEGEVTTVDWCSFEPGKIATCADDFTVRIWNSQSSFCSSTRSPSTNRRRVRAIPSEESRKLLMEDEEADKMNSNTMHKPSTPEAHEKRFSPGADLDENFEKSPEASLKSPSSVLYPPSSLKRKTIRDYFMSTA